MDDLAGAEAAFSQGAGLARLADNRPVLLRALGLRALVTHDRGRLTAAHGVLVAARRLAATLDAESLPAMRYLDLVDGVIRHDRNDLAGAAAALQAAGERDHRRPMPILDYWEAILAARLALARADPDAAAVAIDEADGALQSVHYFPTLPAWWEANIPAWRARLAAARGDLAAVDTWLTATAPRADLATAPLAWWTYRSIPPMLARAYLVLGDAARAMDVVDGLVARADAAGAGDVLLDLLALRVVTLAALAREHEAQHALARMVTLAEPEGYARPFLSEGAPLLDALRRHATLPLPTAASARRLLVLHDIGSDPGAGTVRPPQALPGVEPFTARELDVLRHTATGKTNATIGRELGLTVGTVKWYLRVIFDKLGVTRRTEAVARARQLGLLD